jgi:hypothetical protein
MLGRHQQGALNVCRPIGFRALETASIARDAAQCSETPSPQNETRKQVDKEVVFLEWIDAMVLAAVMQEKRSNG